MDPNQKFDPDNPEDMARYRRERIADELPEDIFEEYDEEDYFDDLEDLRDEDDYYDEEEDDYYEDEEQDDLEPGSRCSPACGWCGRCT
jgi:hypothetical protein